MTSPTARLATTSGRPMSLQRVDARGRVAGLLLSMTVRQAWRNATPDTLEAVYTFPLPWTAVLLGLSVEIGGRRLDGAVLARPDAEARYEEAVAAGDSPIMVRKGSDALYTVDLGNLKSGDEAVVELRWAQLLKVEQGRVRLSVPTTIAPRFGDASAMPGMRPHDSIEAGLSAAYGFSLVLDLDGTLAAGTIASPTHPIELSIGERGAHVRLAGPAWLDRDFVLNFDGAGSAAGTASAVRAPDGAGCVVMASFCPTLEAPKRAAIDLKILVDCSGSMGGDSIASARRGLERLVSALGPADRVTYSRFGSQVQHDIETPSLMGPATQVRLRAAIAATDATLGGTHMEDALAATVSIGGGDAADVLLITDGHLTDIDPIVAAARASRHRVFAVGVGSAPAESLLRQLAEATGGACELVTPGEAIEAAIERTFARLRVPVSGALSMDWGAEPAWTTKTPGALFAGDTVHVFAGFDTVPDGLAPRLSFTVGERVLAIQAALVEAPAQAVSLAADGEVAHAGDAAPADEGPAALLPRIAAWHRIADAAGRGTAAGLAQDLARELALRHRIVTNDTNLFLVHVREAADKATDLPTLQQTQQMLAAGWGATGSVPLQGVASFRVKRSPRLQSQASGSESPALHSIAPWTERMRSWLFRKPAESVREPSASDRALEVPAFLRKASDTEPHARRLSPQRLLHAAESELLGTADITHLVAQLESSLPPWVHEASVALRALGIGSRDGWLLMLGWLAVHFGGPLEVGTPARARLDALLDALPASTRAQAAQCLDEHLAGVLLTAG
ncbi:MAG: VIT domain-containing protein [Burkholderiales bacterium]|nr:VIT domain-containing protein [Burkholderiales bacterium]